jgi:hypothetical protein
VEVCTRRKKEGQLRAKSSDHLPEAPYELQMMLSCPYAVEARRLVDGLLIDGMPKACHRYVIS